MKLESWLIVKRMIETMQLRAYKELGQFNDQFDAFKKKGVVEGIDRIEYIMRLIADYDPNRPTIGIENENQGRDFTDLVAGY